MLVPRPDSEVLIASAIEHFERKGGPARILDLGTGRNPDPRRAGRVAEATGIGTDVSAAHCPMPPPTHEAGVRSSLETRSADWAAGLIEKFDLILCNPPYVADGAELGPGVREYERTSPVRGEEGLDAYRALAPTLPKLLKPAGIAAIEIGADQAEPVTRLLARDGLEARVSTISPAVRAPSF